MGLAFRDSVIAMIGSVAKHNHCQSLVLVALLQLSGCSRNQSEPPTLVMPTQPAPTEAAPAPGPEPTGTRLIHGRSSYPFQKMREAPVPLPEGQGQGIPGERYLAVDQFGYLPQMKKVAVIVNPQKGWNAADSYVPPETVEIRRWKDRGQVLTGKPSSWQEGKTDETSGDAGFWFDFSSLTQDGLYYVYDPTNRVRSAPFEIGANVYKPVLVAASKMYYFNRANVPKERPWACVGMRCWLATADFVGPLQDREARSINSRNDAQTSRDLSGGWWDAGDTNKYVTFALNPVHQLLTAYSEHPTAFTDDFGIPESGNSIPDILDEVLVELNWLKKMQADDLQGGVLLKMGSAKHTQDLPSQDRSPRFYYPGACSSSTIATAGMFAHAALVLRKFPTLGAAAADFAQRAERAWQHFETHPQSDKCDDGSITGGDADIAVKDQPKMAVTAAAYLAAINPTGPYAAYIAANIQTTRPFKEDQWGVYEPCEGDALVFYASLDSAPADIKKRIAERRQRVLRSRDLFGFDPKFDLYRAHMRPYMYHWGSNNQRAALGNSNIDAVLSGAVAPKDFATYWERAAGLLHSFHGVNPMQLVYLSNMYHAGAEDSADEIYHTWFRDHDSTWDNARTSRLGPAPGYVPGGPNRQYCGNAPPAHACSKSPVKSQPPEKSYLDTNEGWNPKSAYDRSWEFSEPGIYYQASYVRLVSKFVGYAGPDVAAAAAPSKP